MLNVIPRFIHDKLKYTYNLREGNFTAATMSIDIVGFTSLTEKLMKKGKSGAEELSVLINKVYEPLINSVYKNHGFVANFAGDAITGIFPRDAAGNVLNAAFSILGNFENRRSYYRRYSGGDEISAQIGLSFGDVSWRIFGETTRAYCFFGDPIYECAAVAAGKGSEVIAVSENLIPYLRDKSGRVVIGNPVVDPKPLTRINRSLVKQFVPEAVLSADYGGEFRNVAPVFIGFKWSDNPTQVNELLYDILLKCDEFGGYFNGIFYDDKGPHALVVFGAPLGYENNVDRAVNFAYSVKKDFGESIKAGITTGTVYAGMVGSFRRCIYTVLGDAVNLAARVMQTAEWGQVRVSSDVVSGISSRFDVEDKGNKAVKGKTEPVALFNVKAVTDIPTGVLFEGGIVGRENELSQMQTFCEPIFDGKFAGATYIYGNAGIGKSRLIHEFVIGLERDVTLFTLQSDSILRKSMNPLVYGLRTNFGQSDNHIEDANKANFNVVFNGLIDDISELRIDDMAIKNLTAELHRTKPLIGGLLGLHWEGSLYEELDPRGRFENTVYALKDFFKAHSLLKPVIIQIEDVQWLDNATLEVFQSLSRNIADFPIAIIASSRFNDDGSKPVLRLDDKAGVNEIELPPLRAEPFTTLIKNRLGNDVDEELSRSILERTEGNPFYIEQFCQYIMDNNLVAISNGEYKLVVKDFDIPEGIKSIIIARLDRLSQRLKEMVHTASVLGREFDIEILTDMLKERTVRRILREGVSEAIWSALSEIKYIFKNALFRDTAYEMQLKKRLQQLHKLAGETLESLYGNEATRYADIAHHYEEAGLKNRTKHFLKKAGDFSVGNYNNDEAIRLYSRLIPYLSDKTEIAEAENEIAVIYNTIGEWDKAEGIFINNIEVARDIGNDELLANTYQKLGLLLRNKGDYGDAFVNYEKAYNIAEDRGYQIICGRSLNAMGIIYAMKEGYDEAIELWRKQENIGLELNDDEIIADVYTCLGNVASRVGDIDKAIGYHNKALSLYGNIGYRKGIADAKTNIAICCAYNNDNTGALEVFLENLEYAIEIGDKRVMSHALYNIGNIYGRMGDYNQAKVYVEKALAISEELGDVYSSAVTTIQLAHALLELGDTEQAEKLLDNVIPICRELNINSNLSEALLNKSEIVLADGRIEEARTYIEETITISKETGRGDIYYKALITDAEIDAVNDLKTAITKLKTIAADEIPPSPDSEARLYYVLFELTNENEYREKALALYRELNHDLGLYDSIIEELQK